MAVYQMLSKYHRIKNIVRNFMRNIISFKSRASQGRKF